MPDINEPLTTARDIGEAILALPQKPMDESLSETLLRLTIAEAAGGFALPSDKPLPPAIKICKSRLAAHGLQASDSVVLMIGALCDRPGTVVLYCAAVKAIAEQTRRQPVTLDDFVRGFAMGFPTDDDLTTVWDRQKARDGNGPDNWLDRAVAWEPVAAEPGVTRGTPAR